MLCKLASLVDFWSIFAADGRIFCQFTFSGFVFFDLLQTLCLRVVPGAGAGPVHLTDILDF